MDRRILVYGSSMSPTYKSPSSIIVHFFKKHENKNLKVNDVVVYWSRGFNKEGKHRFWHMGNCVHRIVAVNDLLEYAMIKGDNRNYEEYVLFKDIKGRVIE